MRDGSGYLKGGILSKVAEGRALAHLNEKGEAQFLDDHLFAVSRIARRLTKKLQMEDIGALLGLLHDLGKYSESFQFYLKAMQPDEDTERDESRSGRVDHSTAGAQVIWNALYGKDAKKSLTAEILSLCIASHHSGLLDCIAPDGTRRLELRMGKADTDTHATEAFHHP
jgi:CRISPR-associated endonuclease/helicase Cas3